MTQQLRLFPCSIPYPDIVYSIAQVYEVINAHQDHFCQGEFLAILDVDEVGRDQESPYEKHEDDEFEDYEYDRENNLKDKKCYKKNCKRPPIDLLCCIFCGGVVWCDWHEPVDMDLCSEVHSEELCLPDCCANNHMVGQVRIQSIERRASRNVITTRKLSENLHHFGKKIFEVTVSEKDYEQFIRDVIKLSSSFIINELEVLKNTENHFPSKRHELYPGTRVIITPGILSSTSLAVRIYYHSDPIEVLILTYEGRNGYYTCLLPEGVIIPEYSYCYSDLCHVIDLDRSCLMTPHEIFAHL